MWVSKLVNLGISDNTSPYDARSIRYTNIFSLLVVLANIIISSAIYSIYGPILRFKVVLGLTFLFGAVLIFSSFKLYNFGRLLLSIVIPIGIMTISVITKHANPDLITAYSYFDTRTVLLGVLVIPLVVFPVKRKFYLLLGTLLPGIFIILYNPIHQAFGVGYEQLLGSPFMGYHMSGIYYSITYVFLVTGLLIFKFSNEKLVTKNINLVQSLRSSNKNLKEASDTIHEQSLALIQSNKELSSLVEQRTADLHKSNEELVKHNLELQQFSNTVSHNLRGPVANLLGLAQLFSLENDQDAKVELINHIQSSATSLDAVLKDLGKIIDIRNHLFQIKENISLTQEFNKVKDLLADQLKGRNIIITTNFEHDNFYSIRSYIDSIFYNLLSNAIKYSDQSQTPKINATSRLIDGQLIIEIEDNGIGINLEKYRKKLFGMYKRFHDHVDGKGLGLFLTKQQVESIGGKIEVESKLGIGTKFIISCPLPVDETISEQVFYESDAVIIWFDAINHISTLVWKRKPTSAEYRDGLTKNLEVFRTYKCHGCIADVRKLGFVIQEDRSWFVQNILADAPELGMEKFIIVHDKDDGKDDAYFQEMRKVVEAHNIYFDHDSFDMDEAKYIIRNKITGL